MTREEFQRTVVPVIIKHAQAAGVDPAVAIAQAAQETGWGKSIRGNNPYNLTGPGTVRGDTDATGAKVKQSFKDFPTIEEGVKEYTRWMQRPRYRGSLQGTSEQRADAIAKGGYATDPHYAAHIKQYLPDARKLIGAAPVPGTGVVPGDNPDPRPLAGGEVLSAPLAAPGVQGPQVPESLLGPLRPIIPGAAVQDAPEGFPHSPVERIQPAGPPVPAGLLTPPAQTPPEQPAAGTPTPAAEPAPAAAAPGAEPPQTPFEKGAGLLAKSLAPKAQTGSSEIKSNIGMVDAADATRMAQASAMMQALLNKRRAVGLPGSPMGLLG